MGVGRGGRGWSASIEVARRVLGCLALASLLSGCVAGSVVQKQDEDLVELREASHLRTAEISMKFGLRIQQLEEGLEAELTVECARLDDPARTECMDYPWHCRVAVYAVGDEAHAEPLAAQHLHRLTGGLLAWSTPLEGCTRRGSRCVARLSRAEAEAIARAECPAAQGLALVPIEGVLSNQTQRFEWSFGLAEPGRAPQVLAVVDAGTGEVLRCGSSADG